MGKVLSLLTRPVRTFNIDNRANKVISKEKPERAPLPKKAEEQLKIAQEANPDFLDKHYKKDTQLDNYLKSVFVTSNDPKVLETEEETKLEKLLPQLRQPAPDYEYGYCEPHLIAEGKCSLKQAVEFINDHSSDPKKYTIEYIAQQYKLDEEVVKFMLEYYKPHKVIVHKKENVGSTKLIFADFQLLHK